MFGMRASLSREDLEHFNDWPGMDDLPEWERPYYARSCVEDYCNCDPSDVRVSLPDTTTYPSIYDSGAHNTLRYQQEWQNSFEPSCPSLQVYTPIQEVPIRSSLRF